MVAVTVTGGVGNMPVSLRYDGRDLAYAQAKAAANYIASNFPVAIDYNPGKTLTPSPGYLIIKQGVASGTIQATGFGAIVDQNTDSSDTINGGVARGGAQIVLASDGGLTFNAHAGMETVIAGGGNNRINLSGDTGASAVYTSTGNDTIQAGDGAMTIAAGGGNNLITLGAGADLDSVTGNDTIHLGAGSDTIDVLSGSAVVYGASSVSSGSGFNLVFQGGDSASTVHGGAGSYSILGGAGGGLYQGGSGGHNDIVAGTGNTTIIGGGAGDTLAGGAGMDIIVAGAGNETLIGGAGQTTFNFELHDKFSTTGFGTVDSVESYTQDYLLNVGNQGAVNYALNTYKVSDGSGSFYLEDGTKVVLTGFAGHLSSSNFTH